MAAVRRGGRWHPPPAPSPRILHLPRRSRISSSRPSRAAPAPPPASSPPRQNLKYLLEQERAAVFGGVTDRKRRSRKKVEEEAPVCSVGECESERWRVEAEILRAECSFLRMEREVAMSKLAKNRQRMESSLRSALGTLISVRKKVDGSEEEEEMAELLKKLEEMRIVRSTGRRRRRRDWGNCVDDTNKGCKKNFDSLRRKLEKENTVADNGEEEVCVREIGVIVTNKKEEVTAAADDPDSGCGRFPDLEMLRKKMEGLSRGMVERMEEYGLFLSAAAAASSSSSSSDMITSTTRRRSNSNKGSVERPHKKEVEDVEGRKGEACCNCKEVVGWIVDQVRAEAGQWNEMQLMLDQLRVEMEDLQSSRDLWHQRAAASDLSLRTLQTEMLGWRRRAVESEDKVTELQEKIEHLNRELHSLKNEQFCSMNSGSRTEDIWIPRPAGNGNRLQRSMEPNREKEKHVLVCRLKKQANCSKRLPLQDIGNSSLFRV